MPIGMKEPSGIDSGDVSRGTEKPFHLRFGVIRDKCRVTPRSYRTADQSVRLQHSLKDMSSMS